MTLRIEIPGPPQTWKRTTTSRGVRVTPKAMRDYQRLIGWHASRAIWCRLGSWPKTARYSVRIEVVPARRQGRRTGADLDNYAKQIDALNGLVWDDDSQVDEIHVLRRPPDPTAPRITIVVDVIVNRP